jgi:hypothetical protein
VSLYSPGKSKKSRQWGMLIHCHSTATLTRCSRANCISFTWRKHLVFRLLQSINRTTFPLTSKYLNAILNVTRIWISCQTNQLKWIYSERDLTMKCYGIMITVATINSGNINCVWILISVTPILLSEFMCFYSGSCVGVSTCLVDNNVLFTLWRVAVIHCELVKHKGTSWRDSCTFMLCLRSTISESASCIRCFSQ